MPVDVYLTVILQFRQDMSATPESLNKSAHFEGNISLFPSLEKPQASPIFSYIRLLAVPGMSFNEGELKAERSVLIGGQKAHARIDTEVYFDKSVATTVTIGLGEAALQINIAENRSGIMVAWQAAESVSFHNPTGVVIKHVTSLPFREAKSRVGEYTRSDIDIQSADSQSEAISPHDTLQMLERLHILLTTPISETPGIVVQFPLRGVLFEEAAD